MKHAVLCISLLLAACGSAALRQEQLAQKRSQLGDPIGAEEAARRAAALREAARLRAEKPHGRVWHDLAMD